MKSMKGLGMSKMLDSIKRKTSGPVANSANIEASRVAVETQSGGSPETTAHNTVKAFCESGGQVRGDEVLFLPTIVEAAESSPAAAAECARLIRKFMRKEYYARAAWQYNALMLLRILTQNPGETFTRNLDSKFADTAKELLRYGVDGNVRQMLMETLEEFENTRSYDEGLGPLIQMWKKEKAKIIREFGGVPMRHPQPFVPMSPSGNQRDQTYFSRSHRNNRLPDAVELASRLEEARTSAKLLEQVVMNTPTAEILDNELIKEFADRCLSASRSIQGYMVATDPAPDNETMESLIDTNEQLQTALNQHQRSVLSARKNLGLNERQEDESQPASDTEAARDAEASDSSAARKGKQTGRPESYKVVPLTSVAASGSGSGSAIASSSKAGKGKQTVEAEDPFADPFADPESEAAPKIPEANGAGSSSLGLDADDYGHHSAEPYSPGFGSSSTAAGSSALASASASRVNASSVGGATTAADDKKPL
ncbi:hypothetical protein VHEMI07140 [[Torrubiella] hemipterigena]|uniref:GAT domain-containing protein n=1 Tax=[Torrubiella] hemipterigena TaxID=1531966 RepID=A0A0A1T9E3_9HYPO|nr:hypothetical protein VHEMI07140 [[Torrubiella] hemipterigena]